MGYGHRIALLDVLVQLGARGPWARSRLAYRLLWSIVVTERGSARPSK